MRRARSASSKPNLADLVRIWLKSSPHKKRWEVDKWSNPEEMGYLGHLHSNFGDRLQRYYLNIMPDGIETTPGDLRLRASNPNFFFILNNILIFHNTQRRRAYYNEARFWRSERKQLAKLFGT